MMLRATEAKDLVIKVVSVLEGGGRVVSVGSRGVIGSRVVVVVGSGEEEMVVVMSELGSVVVWPPAPRVTVVSDEKDSVEEGVGRGVVVVSEYVVASADVVASAEADVGFAVTVTECTSALVVTVVVPS
jgi:hypothetical protein